MDEVLCYARGLFLFSAPVDIILDLICACVGSQSKLQYIAYRT